MNRLNIDSVLQNSFYIHTLTLSLQSIDYGMKYIKCFLIIKMLMISSFVYSQIGLGYVVGFDIYERFKNPADGIASPSSGNALLNGFVGPKIWLGGPEFSVSVEGQINLGLTSFSVRDYKGIGSVSFPVLAKLNFGGNTALDRNFETGYSIGGGIEWSKTELFYLSKEHRALGVSRPFYSNYVIELGIGKGGFGLDGGLYFRYGFNPSIKTNNLHVGLVLNMIRNLEKVKEYKPQKI